MGEPKQGKAANKARDYTEPTKKALFTLSLGRCYEPTCPNRVVEMEGENPVVLVQIAHIRAAKRGGPRYDEDMNDDERRAFPNLILLCTKHHSLVDKNPTGKNFSVEDLEKWKTIREGSLSDDLSSLTEEDLSELLSGTLKSILDDTKDELLEAIGRVEDSASESASLLRNLVTATFERPYLDADAVASLAGAANVLSGLSDYAPMLDASSRRLEGLADYAPMLARSSYGLENLADYAPMLAMSSEEFSRMRDYVLMLQDASKNLAFLRDYAPMLKKSADTLQNAPDFANLINRAAENLTNTGSQISGVDRTIDGLSSASGKLTSNVKEMEKAAQFAISATRVEVPDRWIYIRNSVLAGVAIGISVMGVIWYLVAHSAA